MADKRIGLLSYMLGRESGGTEIYERYLLQALLAADETTARNLDFLPILPYDSALSLIPETYHSSCELLSPRGKLGLMFTAGKKAKQCQADLLHSFFVTPLQVKSMPLINTVYDLGFIRYPEHYPLSLGLKLKAMLHWTIRKADLIVTISEYTRQDLLEFSGMPPERVETVHCAIDPTIFHPNSQEQDIEILKKYGIRQPYILTPGRLNQRKNVIKAVEAYEILRRRNHFSGQIVLVGSPNTFVCQDMQERIDQSPYRSDIVQTGQIPFAEVPILYRLAQVFCFPSLYEGFGFPSLEAMACGIPVVCSNSTCFPEVAGEAAMLVDPLDAEQIASQLDRVVSECDLRNQLIRKGFEQVQKFSWNTAAKQMCDLYRKMS